MLASIAVTACSGGSKGGASGNDTTIGNRTALVATDSDLSASYWCSINNGGYQYPQMPCEIRNENGRYVLTKLAGSQRFRGEVKPRGQGFTFDGEFFCPWGDCTQPLHGVFAPVGQSGALRGTFDDKSIVVTMVRAGGAGAFGGNGYGGAAYGGLGYGGAGYGGATKGQPRPPAF